MDCERALILISAALDGELTREEQAELEEHLAACPACRALADDFGVLSVALSDMEAEPPGDLMARVEAALDQEAQPVTARPRSRWKAWGSLAAMLALAVCLGGVYLWSGGMGGTGADSAASAQSAADAAGSSSQSESDREGLTKEGSASAEEYSAAASDEAERGATSTAPEETEESEQTDTASQSAAADQSIDPAASGETTDGTDSTAEQNNAATTFQSPQEETSAPAADEVPETGEMLVAPPPPPQAADEAEEARADDAQTQSITSLQALEVAFAAAGGLEAYPDAALKSEDPPRYFLSSTQTDTSQTTLLLEYSGLSANGQYYIIRQYEYIVQDGPNGWAHTATVNHYAVSLDGMSVLIEYDEEGSASTTQAYREATGS